jgi:hypothetical protein
MPNLDNSIILEIVKTAPSPGYSYAGLSGLDDTRSHKSQLFVYYRYTTLQDGTPVADVSWNNWYDPFLIPAGLITVDQAILSLSIADTTGMTVVSKAGVPYQMPAMDFADGATLHILRSQEVDNKAVDFGAGTRVTSTALNAAIGQVFGSVQELADRVTSLEGFNFEVPVDSGGSGPGGNLTGGDKVEIFVSGVDLDTWTINQGVVDEDNLNTPLADKINSKVNAAEAAAAAPVQDIQGGTNVTVTDDGNGVFTVNSTGGSGPGGSSELTQELTSTETLGGITAGESFAVGTTLESMWRDLLITYQSPTLDFGNALPGTATHGVTTYSISSLSCTKGNAGNINTGIPGAVNFNDPNNVNDANRSVTWNTSGSQTISFATISGTYFVSVGTPGASGTPLQSTYSISANGTATNGGGFSDSDSINVRFLTYFGGAQDEFSGSNGLTIVNDLVGTTSSNSKRQVTCTAANAATSNFTYFVMPQCHWDGISTIKLNNSQDVKSAFINQGTQIINGVLYTFIQSDIPGAYQVGDLLELN